MSKNVARHYRSSGDEIIRTVETPCRKCGSFERRFFPSDKGSNGRCHDCYIRMRQRNNERNKLYRAEHKDSICRSKHAPLLSPVDIWRNEILKRPWRMPVEPPVVAYKAVQQENQTRTATENRSA